MDRLRVDIAAPATFIKKLDLAVWYPHSGTVMHTGVVKAAVRHGIAPENIIVGSRELPSKVDMILGQLWPVNVR